MEFEKVLEQIGQIGILPVVKIEAREQAAPLAECLVRAGFPAVEITFRTGACTEAIREIKKKVPGVLVGAGTVETEKQAREAMEAGAEFLISPGWNLTLARAFRDLPYIPGCQTPGEVQEAREMGYSTVKIFPAECCGGISYLKTLSSVFSGMKFIPTGGITAETFSGYLKLPSVLACGGSFMAPEKLIKEENFAAIGERCRNAAEKLFGFHIAHVGINCEGREEAAGIAQVLQEWFGFEPAENPSSIFAGTSVEIMKEPYLGAKGHIAIAACFPERAKSYLERKGVRFREESAVYREGGELQAIYFEREIGGFAVHLVRKA